MEILLRNISPNDAEPVAVLSAQLGYDLSIKETTNNIMAILESPDNCAFTAVSEGKTIGWIHAFKTVRIESPSFIEIGGMVVDEAYRGKGVGKALVNKVKEWCVKQNNSNLRVRCNTKRFETHKFYTRIGFRELKEQKVFGMDKIN